MAGDGALTPTAPARPASGETWSTSPLGQILVRLGVVDVVDVMIAAYEQDLGDGRRIGEILMARGLASREDIELALLDQSKTVAGQPAGRVTAPPVESPVPRELVGLAPVPVTAFPLRQGGWLRTAQTLALFLLLTGAALVLTTMSGGPVFGVAVYGLLSLPYLLVKLLLSSTYRSFRGPAPTGAAVTVVLPFYNEDPVTFQHCLTSLATQSLRAEHIYVIDDGSATRACFDVAGRMAALHDNISVQRFPENRGKRAAQAWGFERANTGLVVTVDSDTVVHPDALAEIIKPFADRRVNGVTGYARGLNRKRNLLTRLIDLRYTNAFLYERSAYSVLGSVLCATGVLSAWRRNVVLDNQEDYLNQRFLGTDVHYGDDRRLTAYALRTGRVVLQDSAIALTQLPERLPQFIRQQVRWNKSFFRESLLLLRQMRPWRIAWWLGLAEFLYWMVLTTMLLYAVVIRPAVHGVAPSWQYVAFVALMAYARSIRMIGDGGRLFPLSFLLAPLYGLMNLVLLVPLRLFSLLRLRDGSWGTRKRSRGIRRHSPVRGTADAFPAAAPAEAEAQRTDVLVPGPIAVPAWPVVPCVQVLPSR